MARILRSRRVVAAGAAALVLSVLGGLRAVGADPRPDLPSVPPERLIASALRAIAERTPLSGTVRTHVDLGIPELPSELGPSSPLGVLVSDQTLKVWRSPSGVRVAQLLPFGERDVISNGAEVWVWDSDRFRAWHLRAPVGASPPAVPSMGDLEGLVGGVLEAVRPDATVTESDPTIVAGRASYVISLTPSSPSTLVGRIDLAIDGQTRVPLRLQVFARSSSAPALEIGFESVSFSPVDPAMFSFTPPEGATVTEVPAAHEPGPEPALPEVRTFGEGFGIAVAVRLTSVLQQFLGLFPYAGPLGSAILVDRGDHVWVVAGAVAPEALAAVGSALP
ncbi:MAG TPA: hypothetical protein VFC04_06915 [Actinomycetota bacterium]|nr:hypothetical protein [Actinomycetota bacterium]